MKLTKMIICMFVVCLFFATQTVSAITFDFAAAIDSGYTGTIKMKRGNESFFSTLGNPTGELGGTVLTWLQDGVTLTATSSDFVYLDYNHAGMGVSKTLNTSFQAVPSSDDNVNINEWLNFGFGETVNFDLSTTVFRDASHNPFATIPSGIEMSVDSGAFSALSGLTNAELSSFIGQDFTFRTVNDNHQFYIGSATVSPVPEPATIALFGIGIAGLAGAELRRRRKKKSIDNSKIII